MRNQYLNLNFMEHSRQEFAEDPASQKAKLAYDAQGLVAKAAKLSQLSGKPVDPISLAQRKTDYQDDQIGKLIAAIAKEQGAVNPSIVEQTDPAETAMETAATAIQTAKVPAEAPRQLTPEQRESTLATLAARFKANEYLHKGIEWTRVKASLETKPEALWSINEMEKAGHEPDVYNSDRSGFDIGTCSQESPASGRNCVFDEEAEEWMKTNQPNERFNGNAVAMAKAMGIDLMDPNLYRNVLQKKGKFDMQTWSWLLTRLDIRSTGYALHGYSYDAGVSVGQYDAFFHADFRSWRGSLRVEWAA